MKPQYVIFVATAAGEIVRAFTWCRDLPSGIVRARQEAAARGYGVARVWGQPV